MALQSVYNVNIQNKKEYQLLYNNKFVRVWVTVLTDGSDLQGYNTLNSNFCLLWLWNIIKKYR